MSGFVRVYLDFIRSFLSSLTGTDSSKPTQDDEEEVEKMRRYSAVNDLNSKIHSLRQALDKALVPRLDRDTFEKRLKAFYKEKNNKYGLKNLKKIVDQYIDRQFELFEELSNSYPGADLSWLTNNPELYKLSRAKSEEMYEQKQEDRYKLDELVPTGYVTTLTEQQESALDELWQRLKSSEYYDELINEETNLDGDVLLLRFLRATMKDKRIHGRRLFQVDQAESRLLKTLDWKRKYNFKKEPSRFAEFQKYKPTYIWKDDKVRAPVLIERSGLFWTNADPVVFTVDEWEECFVHGIEKAQALRREVNLKYNIKDDKGIVIIQDLKGLGLGVKRCRDLFALYNRIAGENYPEVVRKIFVVNAPWIFSKIFTIAKMFIDADTISKVEVHNNIPKDLFAGLFDTSYLPEEYGGKSELIVPTTVFYK